MRHTPVKCWGIDQTKSERKIPQEGGIKFILVQLGDSLYEVRAL